MATRISDAARDLAVDAVVDRLDLGAGAGYLELRTGSQPAGPGSAATGTLLATITLADPAYGSAAVGTAVLAGAPRSGTGVAAGDAGWFRMYDSDATAVIDGSVTATGGGGDLELDNVNIAIGQNVSITTLPYTQPASE